MSYQIRPEGKFSFSVHVLTEHEFKLNFTAEHLQLAINTYMEDGFFDDVADDLMANKVLALKSEDICILIQYLIDAGIEDAYESLTDTGEFNSLGEVSYSSIDEDDSGPLKKAISRAIDIWWQEKGRL